MKTGDPDLDAQLDLPIKPGLRRVILLQYPSKDIMGIRGLVRLQWVGLVSKVWPGWISKSDVDEAKRIIIRVHDIPAHLLADVSTATDEERLEWAEKQKQESREKADARRQAKMDARDKRLGKVSMAEQVAQAKATLARAQATEDEDLPEGKGRRHKRKSVLKAPITRLSPTPVPVSPFAAPLYGRPLPQATAPSGPFAAALPKPAPRNDRTPTSASSDSSSSTVQHSSPYEQPEYAGRPKDPPLGDFLEEANKRLYRLPRSDQTETATSDDDSAMVLAELAASLPPRSVPVQNIQSREPRLEEQPKPTATESPPIAPAQETTDFRQLLEAIKSNTQTTSPATASSPATAQPVYPSLRTDAPPSPVAMSTSAVRSAPPLNDQASKRRAQRHKTRAILTEAGFPLDFPRNLPPVGTSATFDGLYRQAWPFLKDLDQQRLFPQFQSFSAPLVTFDHTQLPPLIDIIDPDERRSAVEHMSWDGVRVMNKRAWGGDQAIDLTLSNMLDEDAQTAYQVFVCSPFRDEIVLTVSGSEATLPPTRHSLGSLCIIACSSFWRVAHSTPGPSASSPRRSRLG